ncbi:MAG: hypothetical protein H6582_08370 [Crocinitomicaceae bacterium]|nr:hypothetical protein [Crocinitomicaceae bacterium]
MKRNLLFVMLASTVVLASSCAKKGCTDANANNYSAEAEKDDESCTYTARGTFWYTQSVSIAQYQAGTTTIEVYVGDVASGSPLNVSDYAGPATPSCGDAKTISVEKNMGAVSSKDYTWQAKDQNGNVLYSGTWSATGKAAGSCDVIQIQ